MNEQLQASNRKNGELIEQKAEFFSGPMPHPAILEGYEKVYPGAAKIIFEKFQEQTDHRIGIEKIVIKTSAKREILGLWFGFIITLVTIVGGIFAALKGEEFLGHGLSFAGLALLIGAFVYSKRADKSQDSGKD